jgi:hypothetical protein
MNREKILNTIKSAIGYLENSLELLAKRKEEETFNSLWQASSDVEYCLFLLSLLHSEEPKGFATKQSSSSKQMEVQPALASALDTLKKAKSNIENDNLMEAQEKAWEARNYLFRVQEIFEKKRKIGAEQPSATRS